MQKTNVYKDQSAAYAELVQYDILVKEGIMKLKDGGLMAAFEFRGPDVANSSPEHLNQLYRSVSRVLSGVGEQFMIHVDFVRAPVADYPDSTFPDPTTAMIDTSRRLYAQKQGAHFGSVQVIYVSWLPTSMLEQKFLARIVSGIKDVPQNEVQSIRNNIVKFEAYLEDLAAGLKACDKDIVIRPLGSSELLSRIYRCTTGKNQRVALPGTPVFLDYYLCSEDFYGGMRPKIGRKHLRCLSIEGFPDMTHPGIMDMLTKQQCEYRWNTRWIPHSRQFSEKILSATRKGWSDAEVSAWDKFLQSWGSNGSGRIDVNAAENANEADAALNMARSNVRFGFYTSTVSFMHEDEAVLTENVRDVEKKLANLGFTVRNEEFNCVEAFLGSLPGHGHENVRWPVIHGKNLADMLALTTIWTGHDASPNPMLPPNSAPLIYAGTIGSTPFRVNLHVGDLGHTTIIGPSGSGKSTLLAMLMAQFFRYHDPVNGVEPQVFMFDKGASSFVLCKATGGEYYDLAADDQDTSFAPLVDVDQQGERDWAEKWIEGLILIQTGEARLEPAVRQAIRQGISLLGTAPRHARTITDLLTLLSSPFPDRSNYFREMLHEYTIDSGSVSGRMLDAVESSLNDANFQVFELDRLMTLGASQTLPVLSYLFHAIERRLTKGRPTLIVMDEAWLMLQHPYFQEKIVEWMRTLRRSNASIIFATQNVNDVIGSDIAAAVLTNCATQIWLPNRNAMTPFMSDFYKQAGLTDVQIQIIGEIATPKRDYFLANSDGKRLFNLALTPVQLKFVAASTKPELEVARELIRLHGDDWVPHWLRHWKLDDWAGYHENLKASGVYTNKGD